MTEFDKMLEGKLYNSFDPSCLSKRQLCLESLYEYNNLLPNDKEKQDKLIRKILGSAGKNIEVLPPIHLDYGINISIGDNFFSNYNLTILDVCKVKIGNNVLIGPNVAIYTPLHPIDPAERLKGLEYGKPVTIEDNVWIGGSVVVLPGVTIGKGSVVGAGSVVTHDIESGVVAAGNPCKVIRVIRDKDKNTYLNIAR